MFSITPVRGHCALITPPPAYAGARALAFTGRVADGAYWISSGPARETGLVLGVGWAAAVKESQGTFVKEDFVGVVDDGVVLPAVRRCKSLSPSGPLIISLAEWFVIDGL
jgi:hypothetical protein